MDCLHIELWNAYVHQFLSSFKSPIQLRSSNPFAYSISSLSSIIQILQSTKNHQHATMPTASEHTARNRLATLAAHLLPSTDADAAAIRPLHLSAASGASPSANLKGTLTVVDERTGKKYQIEVSPEGTVRASDFKKVPLMPIHPSFLIL